MAKRSGPSISVKMILTTTLLIVLTVVGAVLVNYYKTGRVYDDVATQQIARRRAKIQQTGELDTPMVARALESQLISNQDEEIVNIVKGVVTQDTRTEDGAVSYGLRIAYVLDLHKNLIVTCTEAKDGVVCKAGDHQPVASSPDRVVVDTWKQVIGAWSKGGNDAKVLASFEAADGPDRYAFFGWPI